jgi:hypothetical protein
MFGMYMSSKLLAHTLEVTSDDGTPHISVVNTTSTGYRSLDRHVGGATSRTNIWLRHKGLRNAALAKEVATLLRLNHLSTQETTNRTYEIQGL